MFWYSNVFLLQHKQYDTSSYVVVFMCKNRSIYGVLVWNELIPLLMAANPLSYAYQNWMVWTFIILIIITSTAITIVVINITLCFWGMSGKCKSNIYTEMEIH